jgi:hypothetical protein
MLSALDMLGFWKASSWLRSRPDPDEDDDQRVLLLPKDSHNAPLPSLHPKPRDGLPLTKVPQQRYVHFGIGGAGNTRKYDSPFPTRPLLGSNPPILSQVSRLHYCTSLLLITMHDYPNRATYRISVCDEQPVRVTPQRRHQLAQSKGGTRGAE